MKNIRITQSFLSKIPAISLLILWMSPACTSWQHAEYGERMVKVKEVAIVFPDVHFRTEKGDSDEGNFHELKKRLAHEIGFFASRKLNEKKFNPNFSKMNLSRLEREGDLRLAVDFVYAHMEEGMSGNRGYLYQDAMSKIRAKTGSEAMLFIKMFDNVQSKSQMKNGAVEGVGAWLLATGVGAAAGKSLPPLRLPTAFHSNGHFQAMLFHAESGEAIWTQKGNFVYGKEDGRFFIEDFLDSLP